MCMLFSKPPVHTRSWAVPINAHVLPGEDAAALDEAQRALHEALTRTWMGNGKSYEKGCLWKLGEEWQVDRGYLRKLVM